MSQAKHQDTVLVRRMLGEAVNWFHESRIHPQNADRDLWDLARECANGAFRNNAVAIPMARREIVARKFMAECQSTFGVEVPMALAESPRIEIVH